MNLRAIFIHNHVACKYLPTHAHTHIYIYSSDSSRIYDMKENASKSNCKDHNLQWTILNMCMVHMPGTHIRRRNHAQTCTRTHTVTHVHIRI